MADEEIGDEGGGGGGGGKGKLIVIIIAVIILIIVGIVAFFFFTSSGDMKQDERVTEMSTSDSTEPLKDPQFLELGSTISNLKEGRRYLKVSITLMLSEGEARDYLQKRLVEVQDIVLSELQSQSLDDLQKSNGKEELTQKLIGKISQIFPSDPDWDDPFPIKKVLFTEFYVQ